MDLFLLQFALDQATCFSDEPNKRVWIQIAKAGTFTKDGRRFDLNAKVFDEMVRNFEATSNRTLQIDFEHASEEPAAELGVEGAPAQGWAHALDNRERTTAGTGLWAEVEWLEPARSYIKAKKYKFISPAFRLQVRHRVTGEPIGAMLSSIALTNDPFLDGMLPVAAKAKPGSAQDSGGNAAPGGGDNVPMMNPDDFMREFKARTGLHPFSDHKECMAHCERLRQLCAMTNHPDDTVNGVRPSEHLEPLRNMMRISATSSAGEVLDEVKKMIAAAMAAHERKYHGVKANNGGESVISGKDNPMFTDAQIAALEKNVSDLKAENAETRLELNKLKTETGEKDKSIEALKKENGEVLKRVEDARVEEAFETYKEQQKLTDDHKESMALTLRANPTKFEKLYPRVTPDKAHLLRRTAPHAGQGNSSVGAGSLDPNDPAAKDSALYEGDFDVHVEHHLRANKGMTAETATDEVLAMRRVRKQR